MKTYTHKTIWLLTAGAFFAFFVFGFSDNIKGAVLPALLQDLNFSYSLGGTILLGIYFGFMAATLTAGFIADTLGHKVVLVLSGICLALGVIGIMIFSSALLLTLSMSILGFGLGSIELGCNTLIVNLHPDNKGRYLNLMAVMHGLGSMLAPLYAGWMLVMEQSWRFVYLWNLMLIIPLTAFFNVVRFPRFGSAQRERPNFKNIGKSAFSRRMGWYYFAVTFYVAAEIGIASWLVEFLQQIHAQSIQQSTQLLSLFFGLMMLGRFVGSFLVERLGYLRSILLATLAGSACIGISLFGPAQFVYVLPVSGLFFSIIFPTMTASASSVPKDNMNTLLGLLFTFAGLGGVMGPWIIGIASDWGGIQFGFGLNLVFGLFTAAAVFGLLQLKTDSR